jgi:hypothetical protein
MVAHIVHDSQGTIRSVTLQATGAEGDLEIRPHKDEGVTAVDLSEVFPGRAVDTGADIESSKDCLQIGRDIRNNFRLDVNRKELESLK